MPGKGDPRITRGPLGPGPPAVPGQVQPAGGIPASQNPIVGLVESFGKTPVGPAAPGAPAPPGPAAAQPAQEAPQAQLAQAPAPIDIPSPGPNPSSRPGTAASEIARTARQGVVLGGGRDPRFVNQSDPIIEALRGGAPAQPIPPSAGNPLRAEDDPRLLGIVQALR